MRKQPQSDFKGNLSERKFEERDRLGGGGWKEGGKRNGREVCTEATCLGVIGYFSIQK